MRKPDFHAFSRAVGPAAAKAAEDLWANLNEVIPTLPLPVIMQGETEGSLQFSWNCDRYRLDIEVLSTGQIERFYRDRLMNEVAGTDDEPVDPVPPELIASLHRLL